MSAAQISATRFSPITPRSLSGRNGSRIIANRCDRVTDIYLKETS